MSSKGNWGKAGMPNRFVATLREKVKWPNPSGQYGDWDILNRDQRKFLIECADYMDVLERRIYELEMGGDDMKKKL